jgi:hypothetical protein
MGRNCFSDCLKQFPSAAGLSVLIAVFKEIEGRQEQVEDGRRHAV